MILKFIVISVLSIRANALTVTAVLRGRIDKLNVRVRACACVRACVRVRVRACVYGTPKMNLRFIINPVLSIRTNALTITAILMGRMDRLIVRVRACACVRACVRVRAFTAPQNNFEIHSKISVSIRTNALTITAVLRGRIGKLNVRVRACACVRACVRVRVRACACVRLWHPEITLKFIVKSVLLIRTNALTITAVVRGRMDTLDVRVRACVRDERKVGVCVRVRVRVRACAFLGAADRPEYLETRCWNEG